MSRGTLAVSGVIDAPPEVVYGTLADYRHGHPSILPEKYFKSLKVEKGGVGAGTVITVKMRVMGTENTLHMEVSEPEPGRILREVDAESYTDTTFTVEPIDGGAKSRLEIKTVWTRPGVRGAIERLTIPGMARKIYREEMALIAQTLRGRTRQNAPSA